MQTYNNLPGVIVNPVDGGLTSAYTPKDDAVLVLGTAGEGIHNTPYQMTNLGSAASEFGYAGSLFRGMAEAATYSDNVIGYRIGATPMKLKGVGTDTTGGAATPGFDILFTDVTSDAATRYSVWYAAGVLAVWKDGEIQFSNQTGAAVDTGDISISSSTGATGAAAVAGNVGLALGTGESPTLATAVTVANAVLETGTTAHAVPTLVNPIDGTGLTKRQIYVAMRQAFELLQGLQVKIVYVPDATIDNPNVAFYVTADATTAANNPATNPNALDWLKVTQDQYNDNVYQWASELADSTGATVTAMVATTAATRIAAGFNEVNFAHSIASFCAEISQLGPKCVGVLGSSFPTSTSLIDTRKWVGFLPVYNTAGQPTKAGGGLLGNAYMSGTTSTKLNPLCSDYANGFRLPGLFVTANDAYDGAVEYDINSNPIDAGAFLHVFADFGFISSSYAQNYINNGAGLVAGYLSQLDAASGLTNKQIKITQVWTPLPAQLDALTEAKINVLRTGGQNQLPTLLHDLTAASNSSDYTNLVRVRCMGVVIQTMQTRANKYVGQSSLDGLTLVAMQAQLIQDLVALQARGYCTRPNIKVTSTPAQQRIGHATLYLTCHPADELIQLAAFVAVGQ
jgi:hypothetical protein